MWVGENAAVPAALLIIFVFFLGACGSSSSNNQTNANATAPTITSEPSSQTVVAGQTATFSVTAAGTAPLNYQWQKNSASISGATSASYTTPAATSADNGATFRVVVSNAAGNVTSSGAILTVGSAPSPPVASSMDVLTYHNDIARTGQNLNETILTPGNVNSANFGVVGSLPVSGLVDAEPLYVSGLTVAGAQHNVVFVVTEEDLVYAFDADSFAQLWQTSVLGSNEVPSDSGPGGPCGQIQPHIGITSTPVIDLAAGPHGTILLVAMSKDSSGNYFQRLHALDLATGAERSGSPVTIQATFPGSGANSQNGNVVFDPKQYAERAGLLLLNGNIYMGWTSHCDIDPYTGWLMGYSESTFQQAAVLNVTPNGSEGSVWMAGAGLAADSSGNIYFLDANGTFDTTLNGAGFPIKGDFGNAFIKLSTSPSLQVADYFAPSNTVAESTSDVDLGSGGALVLPDLTDSTGKVWHLAVGAGKDGNIYVVNRDSMGKFNPGGDGAIYQKITSGGIGGPVYSMPAYFNNTVYYGAVGDNLRAFSISNARLATPSSSQSAITFAYPGATPSVSANGTANGIVWVVENAGGSISNPGGTAPLGVLHAYSAANLSNELYNSTQAGTRDQFSDNKFITPMIANGKVYVGTSGGNVIVFGLLSPSSARVSKRPTGSRERAPIRRTAARLPPRVDTAAF